MAKKVVIKIGRGLKKKSAAQAKAILQKRYPQNTKEIEACIAEAYKVDEGAKKLNESGDTGSNKNKSSGS